MPTLVLAFYLPVIQLNIAEVILATVGVLYVLADGEFQMVHVQHAIVLQIVISTAVMIQIVLVPDAVLGIRQWVMAQVLHILVADMALR